MVNLFLTNPPPSEYSAGTVVATCTLNLSNGTVQSVTVTANVTFTITNPVIGQTYTLRIIQDSTGGWTYTWPVTVKWTGGTAPTGSAANKNDIITLYWDGTSYYGRSNLNY